MGQISVQKEAETKTKEKTPSEQKAETPATDARGLARRLQHPFEVMRRMLRWDPFETMSPWRSWREIESGFAADFNIKETKDAFVFTADVPGIEAKDIDVKLAQNRLTVSGKRDEEKTQEDDAYYTYERSYGSFTRSFTLPEAGDADKISADLKDGVLTVTIPKTAATKTKRVEVKAS
jgi:HSP20 family protein